MYIFFTSRRIKKKEVERKEKESDISSLFTGVLTTPVCISLHPVRLRHRVSVRVNRVK